MKEPQSLSLFPSVAGLLTLLLIVTGCGQSTPASTEAPVAPTIAGPVEEGFVHDGVLDCLSAQTWSQQRSLAPGTKGEDSAIEALNLALKPWADKYELGSPRFLNDSLGILVDGDREVLIATAGQAPAGGWWVPTLVSCGPYRLS